jgi:hypothetical protein
MEIGQMGIDFVESASSFFLLTFSKCISLTDKLIVSLRVLALTLFVLLKLP